MKRGVSGSEIHHVTTTGRAGPHRPRAHEEQMPEINIIIIIIIKQDSRETANIYPALSPNEGFSRKAGVKARAKMIGEVLDFCLPGIIMTLTAPSANKTLI